MLTISDMADELRHPMILLVKAKKKRNASCSP